MGAWTFTIPVPTLNAGGGDGTTISIAQDDLTAGEWAAIYELAATALPHAERDVSPLHCPLCRNAIAVIALSWRGPLDMATASALVRDAARDELVSYIGVRDD